MGSRSRERNASSMSGTTPTIDGLMERLVQSDFRQLELARRLDIARRIIEALTDIATAAETLTSQMVIPMVADKMINAKTGEIKLVPVSQEYVNEVWNELVDKIKLIDLEKIRDAISQSYQGGDNARPLV